MVSLTSFPKEKIKILLVEGIHRSAVDIFEGEGFQIETLPHALSGQELLDKIHDVHVLGIRSKTYVGADVFAHAPRLLSVGCFCIGTNQVDVRAANAMGVPVFNAPFSNTRSVAELVMGEIIALSRQLCDRASEMRAGVWKKTAAGSYEVRGKTLGIVGYGHIGSQVGILAEMFGMRVVFYDVLTKLPLGNSKPCDSLHALLEQSDYVTLHVPATPQTHGMIGAHETAAMKKGACLLNLSRGTVVDLEALSEALLKGHLKGAAVDVFPEEPESNGPGFVTPLQACGNVILTPHVGGSTAEAQEAIGKEVALSLIKYVNTGATTGAVNFPHIEVPAAPGTHRILNVHRNVPGVLRDINKIVSDLQANIHGQVLRTDDQIGYLMMDLDQDVSNEVKKAVGALTTNIKTRILY